MTQPTFVTFLKSNSLVIIIAAVITLWFPFTMDWSDYHGYIYSLESMELIYNENEFRPFFLLPWAIPLLLPFTAISYGTGWIIFNTLTLLIILFAIWQFSPTPNTLTLLACFLNLFFIIAIRLGQWDGLLLGFIAISVWALHKRQPILLGLGLLLMTTKPLNVWLVGLVILICIRNWEWRELAKLFIIPVLALIGSLIWRPTWPIDYYHYVQATPPQNVIALNFINGFDIPLANLNPPIWLMAVTLAIFISFIIAIRPNNLLLIAAALCSNLMLTSYLQLYHYVILIPAVLLIATNSRPMRLLIVIYIISIPAQFFIAQGISLMLFPLILLIMLTFRYWGDEAAQFPTHPAVAITQK